MKVSGKLIMNKPMQMKHLPSTLIISVHNFHDSDWVKRSLKYLFRINKHIFQNLQSWRISHVFWLTFNEIGEYRRIKKQYYLYWKLCGSQCMQKLLEHIKLSNLGEKIEPAFVWYLELEAKVKKNPSVSDKKLNECENLCVCLWNCVKCKTNFVGNFFDPSENGIFHNLSAQLAKNGGWRDVERCVHF